MPDEVVRETRIIEVRVTRKPDLSIPGGATIVPATVELTYTWPRGGVAVEIRGPRRLASGRTTSGSSTRLLHDDPRPDWLVQLIDKYRPDGW